MTIILRKYKIWGDLMETREWRNFALSWKRALLNWPDRKKYGYDVERDVEEIILEVCNLCNEKFSDPQSYKIAFDENNPNLISFDGKEWVPLVKQPKMGH